MANRQLIRDLIKKYTTPQYYDQTRELIELKIEWQNWHGVPAEVAPWLFHFSFEGEFIDQISSTEAKILALHEIAHFNAAMHTNDVKQTQHGEPINELIFYSLIGKEHLSYDKVNRAIAEINRKFKIYKNQR